MKAIYINLDPYLAAFAGVDIEGAEFDGNEIVADESTGALSAPAAGG